MEDKFLMQTNHAWTRGETLLDLLLTNEEEILDDIKLKDSLASSDQETVELKILRGLSKTSRMTTASDFRKANLAA